MTASAAAISEGNPEPALDFDAVIIGAGVSGLDRLVRRNMLNCSPDSSMGWSAQDPSTKWKGRAMKKLAALLGMLVLAALVLSPAEAKKKPGGPAYLMEQYLDDPTADIAPLARGDLKRFVINPHGEVDGFILADGTLVKFPPHMSTELTAAVKAGDTVSVRGFREFSGNVRAVVVTNEASKRAVVERLPAPGMKMPKHLRFAMLSRLQVSGKIERTMYGKKGELNGVILDNGTVVRFPKHAAFQFAAQLRPGRVIAVEGLGTQNEFGRAIEAIALKASPQTLPNSTRG